MEKKVLIVDNDAKQVQRIADDVRQAASEQGKKVTIFKTSNVSVAEKILKRYDVDVLILNIVYKRLDKEESQGVQLVSNVRKTDKYASLPVIFISLAKEWKEYAYKKLLCLGFFPKDYEEEEFFSLMKVALQYTTPKEEEKQIVLRKWGIVYPVIIKEIVYVTVASHILCFYFRDGEKLEIPNLTMKRFCDENKSRCLIRCNRNLLVNRIYVESVDMKERYLTLKGSEEKIMIGSNYIKNIEREFYIKRDGKIIV